MATETELLALAETLNNARMEAIKPLSGILARRAELLRQIAETETEYGQAYATAVAAGWSDQELKRLKVEPPTRRPKGRPRKSPIASTSTTAPATSSTVPEQTTGADASSDAHT